MLNANVAIFNTSDWVLEIWKKVNKGITSQLSEQGSHAKLKQIRKINIQMLLNVDTRFFFLPSEMNIFQNQKQLLNFQQA